MRHAFSLAMAAALLSASAVVAVAQTTTPRATSPVPNTDAEVRSEGRQIGGSPPASATVTSPGATVVTPPPGAGVVTGSTTPPPGYVAPAPGATNPTAEPDKQPTTNSLTGAQQRNQPGAN